MTPELSLQEQAAERQRARMERVNLRSESCDGRALGLARFSSPERIAHRDVKTRTERILNPFGDPWVNSKRMNRFIPVGTSSCRHLLRLELGRRTDVLEGADSQALADYLNYAKHANSPYHYDEQFGRLSQEMRYARLLRALFEKHGLKKKLIGYAVVNFVDGTLFSSSEKMPESSYLHYPEDSLDPNDRLHFKDVGELVASGDVFDIRRPEVRRMIATRVAKRTVEGELDAVLIDYAVRRYAFGLPTLIDKLPESWVDNFQESQLLLMTDIHQKLKAAGKELFLNGMMLDSIAVTEPTMTRMFAKACDGLFWEQPFRWEWKTYLNGEEDYYDRIERFITESAIFKKKIIFKVGSYRYHGTEDVISGWLERYKRTDAGIERHLAKHFTCFFLLFANRHYHTLIYTHPTEVFDIFASEAYFDFWDTDIGEPTGRRQQLADHVFMRPFERGVVVLNNNKGPATVVVPLPESLGRGPSVTVQMGPLSGEILVAAPPPPPPPPPPTTLTGKLRAWVRNAPPLQPVLRVYRKLRYGVES